MASPPFNPAITTPADTDIVSQFPAAERTFRDIINSWILQNHDVNGNHAVMFMIQQGSAPSAPAAGTTKMYVDSNGNLSGIDSVRGVFYVGNPPGIIIYSASGTLESGYLRPDGSAVSRSTFAALYARIGTVFGAGDGSTTFNLPNLKGRVIAGYDTAAALLSTAGSGVDSATLGATGGAQNYALTVAQLPVHTHANTVGETAHSHDGIAANTARTIGNAASGTGTPFISIQLGNGDDGTIVTGTATAGVTITNASTGSGTAHPIVQPTIILLPMIKY